jgi:mycothione reductase
MISMRGSPIGHDEGVTHYDLALIGTGSGNSVVDKRFADRRVAIIEENKFGGTCLNVGCIPTKMFVYPADLARNARHGSDLGVLTSYDGARWPEIRDRIFGRIDPIEDSGRHYRHSLDYIDVFEHHCTFVDNHTLLIHDDSGQEITADEIVIAAGSRVLVAPIPGLDDVAFETSDTVMRLEELPRRMTIIGGGFVAAEFAHVFSALGTAVTVVHRGDALLQKEDREIAEAFTRLASTQWDVRLSTTATGVAPRGTGQVVTLSDGSTLESDVLLLATGRMPNADRLGLEHTDIAVQEEIVVVDEFQRTTVPGIWALGDVANTWQLKHVANAESRTVQHNLLHPDDLVATDHRFVPSAVFTSPQVASAGITSQHAQSLGIEHRAVTHDYADIAYGWAMESTAGDSFVKLIGTPDGQHLLGAHLIGPQASNLIQPLLQGMSLGTTVPEMARGQYWIHPAMAEVVENALLKLIS